eukprot:TRINITY_DN39350_c0_g1_i1.p1 TRINITY_DN39350_c0_g1~~TRINITY_DN39350_c0_g1_i1.p1  ORF type:complete len:157 (+),score=51.46 TRINITY_DN39350_c0_g1_i1:148-618(+)
MADHAAIYEDLKGEAEALTAEPLMGYYGEHLASKVDQASFFEILQNSGADEECITEEQFDTILTACDGFVPPKDVTGELNGKPISSLKVWRKEAKHWKIDVVHLFNRLEFDCQYDKHIDEYMAWLKTEYDIDQVNDGERVFCTKEQLDAIIEAIKD